VNKKANMIEYPGEKLYTIGTVSKLTGVGAITLRAWERRYGLIEPVRKESGHRLFTRHHVDQINRITALTQQGMRISQIRPEMLETDVEAESREESDTWSAYLSGMVAAIIDFNEERLEAIYNEALSHYPIGIVTRNLLTPLLIELGLRWASQDGSIAEEHFFTFYLRNKIGARYHHRARSNNRGPCILLAGLPNEHHDIGLLLFALAAYQTGYQVIPLGANMPLDDLAYVAKKKHCSAILLSGTIEPSDNTITTKLKNLVESAGMPVLVGGLSSVYACDDINRAGAEALGRNVEHGIKRLGEILS
jgi:DNA-binding transcriptional MerR regulator/methylmalonyl-CoA mutase cobalamin-binding subunit